MYYNTIWSGVEYNPIQSNTCSTVTQILSRPGVEYNPIQFNHVVNTKQDLNCKLTDGTNQHPSHPHKTLNIEIVLYFSLAQSNFLIQAILPTLLFPIPSPGSFLSCCAQQYWSSHPITAPDRQQCRNLEIQTFWSKMK